MQDRMVKVSLEDVCDIMTEKLDSGGEIAYSPKGRSMLPLIKQGRDTVILKKPDRKLKKGDIIFLRRTDGSFVLHRIIKVQKDGKYTICGDNQYILEKNIDNDNIIARICALKRGEKDFNLDGLPHKIYFRLLFLRRFRLKYLSIRAVKTVVKKILRFFGLRKDGAKTSGN